MKNKKEIRKAYRQAKEDFKYGRRFEEKELTEEELRLKHLLEKDD